MGARAANHNISEPCHAPLQTPPANGNAVANMETSVAFPAGWNNTKPWFVGSGAGHDSAQAQGPVQANPVKPMMPPPPFPSQPWQGSRLGPLPPVRPLAQCPMTAQQVGSLLRIIGVRLNLRGADSLRQILTPQRRNS